MSRIKPITGLLLAALMLFTCMPLSLAAPEGQAEEPAKITAEAEEAQLRDITGELIFDRPYVGDVENSPEWTIPLTQAAGPVDAVKFVGISENASDFYSYYDEDLGRVVAHAAPPYSEGSYNYSLLTYPMNLQLFYSALRFRVKGTASDSLRIFCRNVNTNETWSPSFTVLEMTEDWSYAYVWLDDGNDNIEYDETYNITVELRFDCTVTSSSMSHYCSITELQLFNGSFCDFITSPKSDLEINAFSSSDNYWPNGGFINYECTPIGGLFGRSDEDMSMGFTAHVAANAGDVLSFKYVSVLDYMAGAEFRFGTGASYDDMDVLFSGYNEGGDGGDDWASWSYTIPATGEYDFIWVLETYDSRDSFLYLTGVELTPRMSLERQILDSECNAQLLNSDDYPWYPVLYKNEIWYRSAQIDHNGASQFISPDNMLKEGDLFYIRAAVSSEKNFDKFNVYMLNTAKEGAQEELIYSISGSVSDDSGFNFHIPEDGIYTFRFVYQKDSSVSSGSDCAYVRYLYIRPMSVDHAAAFDSDSEDWIYADDYIPEPQYGFRPALFDGEVILATDNQGVKSSAVTMFINAELEPGDIFSFEYIKDAEANYDNLTIYLNEEEYEVIKPRTTEWQTFVYHPQTSGMHSFKLRFNKDSSVDTGTDTVYIRNVKSISGNTLFNQAIQLDYQGDDYLFQYEDGGFEIIGEDDRTAVCFTAFDNHPNAAIGAQRYCKGFDYVTFSYKVEGDASLQFVVANHESSTETLDHTNGQWRTFYHRIPYSEDWLFVLNAESDGGVVYIDDFYIGSLEMDLVDALESPDHPAPDWDDIDYSDFIGIYDPLEPNGRQEYGLCNFNEGEEGLFNWCMELQQGDSYNVVFCFRDEDGQPNGSGFTLYLDGEGAFALDDTDGLQLNKWYRLVGPVVSAGEHSFELTYYSQAQADGDGLCIYSIYATPVGCTLDEALNVEGGDIHFETPNGAGCFIPVVEEDIAYANPYEKISPYSDSDFIDYSWSFESEDELSDWVFIDADGDGYCWKYYNANADSVSNNTSFGTGVLCSESYTYDGQPLYLDPDNWALSPEIAIPEDCGHVNVSFLYSGCNSGWYAEHFGVYVGTGTDISTYEFQFDLTIEDSDWNSLAFDLNDYAGQTVRVALRHYDSYNVYKLMIDHFMIWNEPVAEASVTFEYDVNYGDEISFDVQCRTDEEMFYSGVYISLWINGEPNHVVVNARDVVEEHGSFAWVTYSCTIPFSGHVTFELLESVVLSSGSDAVLCLDIDNVKITRQYEPLPGDVDLDGRITYSDISLLYMYLLGLAELTPEAVANADFNGDGSINYVDITDLSMYMLTGA